MTPDRMIAQDVGVTNHAIHLRNLYAAGVTIQPDLRLLRLDRDGNQVKATFQNEYSTKIEERSFDQIIVEAGTVPMDDLMDELATNALNGGEIDVSSFLQAQAQPYLEEPSASGYALFRIGDCVSARGIHAAMLDANRLCQSL